ncbi:MAG: 3-keto-5-aminohexanoate cleavage protein, partial [Candidatus Accumulibacter sp.]|nr:3-keto-5-aminohexanoate cleavage protein [Accumulibacter sp.]
MPITAEEIAADVIACARAGAAIAHLHVRDENGKNSMSTEVFTEV